MLIEGDPRVLENFFRKKHLLEVGDVDHLKYRTWLQGNPGGMAAIHSAAYAQAFAAHGLVEGTSGMFGVSANMAVLSFLLAGQMDKLVEIFIQKAASKEFISWPRFLKGAGPLVDMDFLSPIFRRELDQEAVRRSRREFWGGLTCATAGRGIMVDMMRSLPDMVDIIHAGMTIPSRFGPVQVGNDWCVDGAGVFTFPAQYVIETFGPTDLLMWANRTDVEWWRFLEDAVVSLPMRRSYSTALCNAFATRHRQALAELRYLRSQTECRYLIVWSGESTGTFECRRPTLRRILDEESRQFGALLAAARACVEHEQKQPLAAE